MRPLCGKKHGGNRKSQGALARLCEFPGRFRFTALKGRNRVAPFRLGCSLKSPRNPITPFETSRVATLHPWLLKRSLEDMRHRLSEKSTFTLHMLHMLHMSDMLKENDIRRKSNGFELLPPPAGGPPPSMREVLGEGKSKVCRMSAGARCAPLQRGGKLQLRDAFATLGCIIATVRCICNRRLHRRPP